MIRVALELTPHFRRDVWQRFFPRLYRCNRGIVSPSNHAPIRGVPCRANPRLRATMNMLIAIHSTGFGPSVMS